MAKAQSEQEKEDKEEEDLAKIKIAQASAKHIADDETSSDSDDELVTPVKRTTPVTEEIEETVNEVPEEEVDE